MCIRDSHFFVRKEFKEASYLDRYRILCQRLVLEHKYSAVSLIATTVKGSYENLADNISIDTFIDSFRGHLLGNESEFK